MSMVEFVRRRKKGIVNFILLGLAVILMVSFGLDSFLVKGPKEDFAVKINGQEISQGEYQRKLRSMEQLYSAQLKGMFEQIKGSLNLPQKIADQMIEERLLSGFLSDLGLSASHFQLEERIAQLPYFGGKIDQQSYISYLQAAGLSEKALMDSMTKEVVEGELSKAFSQLAPLAEEELKGVFFREQQKAKFVAAKFTPQITNLEVPDSEIEKYYNEHKNEFINPKEVKLEYVLLSAKKFLDKVPVVESDLRQLYEENSSQYMEPEKILLSKISFVKEPEPAKDILAKDILESTVSPNDKKQRLAQSVIERVKKGEDFGQLARELSEDPESKKKSGELGWKKTTELSEEVRTGLAEIATGTTSGLIEESNEIAVYFVNQRQAERQLPFESVKEELTKELKASDAPLYLEIEADKLFSQLQSSLESLQDFSKRESLDYKLEKSLRKQSVGISKSLKQDAIDSEQGVLRMISAEDGVYFYKVLETLPERPKIVAEVKEEILSTLRKSAALVVAKTKAEEFLKSSISENSFTSFKSNLNALGAETVDTSLESVDAQKATFISSTEEAFPLYSLTTEKPVYNKVLEQGEAFYVVMLTEKKEANTEDYAKKKVELFAEQSQKTSSRLLDSLVAALRAESQIEINPSILNEGA